MGNLPADIEQQLASMSEGDFNAFIARVRAPDTTEQLRTVLARHISGDQLEAVLQVANPAAFVDEHGAVDETKVAQSLGGLFGIHTGPTPMDFGQHRPPPLQPGPGEQGAAEAAKRFGGQQPQPPSGRGAGGAAEAARRFGKQEQP